MSTLDVSSIVNDDDYHSKEDTIVGQCELCTLIDQRCFYIQWVCLWPTCPFVHPLDLFIGTWKMHPVNVTGHAPWAFRYLLLVVFSSKTLLVLFMNFRLAATRRSTRFSTASTPISAKLPEQSREKRLRDHEERLWVDFSPERNPKVRAASERAISHWVKRLAILTAQRREMPEMSLIPISLWVRGMRGEGRDFKRVRILSLLTLPFLLLILDPLLRPSSSSPMAPIVEVHWVWRKRRRKRCSHFLIGFIMSIAGKWLMLDGSREIVPISVTAVVLLTGSRLGRDGDAVWDYLMDGSRP